MIDLEALSQTTGLSPDSAEPLAFRAAMALQRRHEPGVSLVAEGLGPPVRVALVWRKRTAVPEHEDINRVTEEGAEAIALALVASTRKWRVGRRLQSTRGERADWLLKDPTGAHVLLEVGGTDEGELSAGLARKRQQVESSPFASRCALAACVVRFAEPRALLWSNDDQPR